MSEPQARLCHMRKWPDFNGYGFNLHAERGKSGQYIGSIDPHSPAESAGLQPGDRIIEVNGVNIGSENHQQVVQRIKAVPDETRLLVVDKEADEYFKSKNIVIRGDLEGVLYLETPETNPFSRELEPDELPSDMSIRQCNLTRWPDFDGFGFNLHSEKGKPGQFIGKVDSNSPAEAAGLLQNDWIVEVNGHNVTLDMHADVVQKIKAGGSQVSLLVVDSKTNEFLKSKNIMVSSNMPSVTVINCPAVNPYTTEINEDLNHVNGSEGANGSSNYDNNRFSATSDIDIVDSQDAFTPEIEEEPVKEIPYNASTGSLCGSSNNEGEGYGDKSSIHSGGSSGPPGSSGYSGRPTFESTSSYEQGHQSNEAHKTPVVVGGIEFAGSAKEAREKLKKKRDVRGANMTMKDKYEMLQRL